MDPNTARFWLQFIPTEVDDTLHTEILYPSTRTLLESHGPELAQPGFVLCGGTGIAIRLGHRQSDDLDLFTTSEFDADAVLNALKKVLPEVDVIDRGINTLHLLIATDVKVSYLKQAGIAIQSDAEVFGVPLATTSSLIVLKANAIVGRGSKKDFIDLYEMFQHGLTVEGLLRETERRAPDLKRQTVLRALTYFQDADPEPLPKMTRSLNWENVKGYLNKQVAAYVSQELHGPRL